MSNRIKIDSSLRVTPGSVSQGDFFIQLPWSIDGTYELKSLLLSTSNYNVNTTNSTIYFNENSTNKTATIGTGFWDGTTLPAQVASVLTTASGGYATYTCAVNAQTQQMTITSTQNFSLKFGSNSSNSASTLLGYANADTTAATSAVSTGIVNLAPIRSYNIQIDNDGGTSICNGSQVTFIIPCNVNSQSFLLYEPSSCNKQFVTFSQPTSRIRVRVLDDFNNVIALQSDFYMIWQKV